MPTFSEEQTVFLVDDATLISSFPLRKIRLRFEHSLTHEISEKDNQY